MASSPLSELVDQVEIPVFWVSRHENILARGYADQGLLEALFEGRLWQTRSNISWKHYEVGKTRFPQPEGGGAVVVVPARHHASPRDIRWLLGELSRLDWSLVILSGDEEWVFPWSRIRRGDKCKVWVMQPRIEHVGHVDGMIPGGWYPGTDLAMAKEEEQATNRSLDWFFAGQVTHSRREQCVEALKELDQHRGLLHETEGYLQGMPQEEYWKLMAGAKVVPCPSGPITVDTARTMEALEAGCVPIQDALTPNGTEMDWYWLAFGIDPPLIWNWQDVRKQIEEQVDTWPSEANRLSCQWQAWKRRITYQLEDQVRELAGMRNNGELITAIITTSPTQRHPNTDHLEVVLESIRQQLPGIDVVIACDGVRPEQEYLRDQYEEYLRRIIWCSEHEWTNVLPIRLEEWGHQANSVRAALDWVRTPLVLMVEHDTPIEGSIDWDALSLAVLNGDANAIRLHIDVAIHPEHEELMIDHDTQWVCGAPLRKTFQWWQRPHLASVDFYRSQVMPLFTPDSRTMIEDFLYGIIFYDGEEKWDKWRLWVYTPENESEKGFKRSGHLDSRGDEPKYGMTFPPQPTSSEGEG